MSLVLVAAIVRVPDEKAEDLWKDGLHALDFGRQGYLSGDEIASYTISDFPISEEVNAEAL